MSNLMEASILSTVCILKEAFRLSTHVPGRRLRRELEDLSLEFDGLVAFMETLEFSELERIERTDLMNQRDAMSWYKQILERRINRAGG